MLKNFGNRIIISQGNFLFCTFCFSRSIIWRRTSSHTRVSNHGTAQYVTARSTRKQTCSDTCWYTRLRRDINVLYVIRPSHNHRHWKLIKLHMPRKNHSSVKFVVCILFDFFFKSVSYQKKDGRDHATSIQDIRLYMPRKKTTFECKVCGMLKVYRNFKGDAQIYII